MSITHDITIVYDTTVVGSTLSRISVCPSEHPGRPTGKKTGSQQQPTLRYEYSQPHRDSIICNGTKHYVCTLTKLHGPDGLFVLMHDRTLIGQAFRDSNRNDKKHTNPDTSLLRHSSTCLSTRLPARSRSSDHSLAAAPLGPDRTSTTTTTCPDCRHRTHNVKGVLDWHRFRVEMLRHVVEERYQHLLLEQGLDPFDLTNNSSWSTVTRLEQASPQDKTIQHNFTQQTFHRPMQPILYPNKGCQDGYWDVLLRISWDSMLLSKRRTTTIGYNVSGEGIDLMSALEIDAQDTYHHGVTTGGDSTCFGDNGISGDTVPSSSGIRVKAQQPIYVNPRVKFPTVYEIDTSSGGGEEGMRPLHGGRGFPLVRYPSGQVKVLWGASLSELYRDLDWDSCLVRSNGDRDNGNIKEWEVVEATEEECTEEDAMETLNDSCPRKYGRVMNTCRYGGIFHGRMQRLAPINPKDDSQAPLAARASRQTRHTPSINLTSITNPALDAHISKSGCDTTLQGQPPASLHDAATTTTAATTTESTSILPAQPQIQSLKNKLSYPIISHSKSLISSSLSLRTIKHIQPPSSDNHHLQRTATVLQQQNHDDTVVAICLQDEGRKRIGQGDGGYLQENRTREAVVSSHDDGVAQGKEILCVTQRRNGKQFFEGCGSGSCRANRISSLSDYHDQSVRHWIPSITATTISRQQALGWAQVESTRGNSFYFDMMTMTTIARESNIYNHDSPLYDTQVQSQPPTVLPPEEAPAATNPTPKLTTSTASTASISSNKSGQIFRPSTAGPTPLKRSSSLSASSTSLRRSLTSTDPGLKGDKASLHRSTDRRILPSIASILNQSPHSNNSNSNNNNNNSSNKSRNSRSRSRSRSSSSDDYSSGRSSMSSPSLVRDSRVLYENSRLVEKGIKFVPDDAPQAVRVGRTVELIRLAKQPLEVLPTSPTTSTAARTARRISVGDSPISPTSFMFWKAPSALARRNSAESLPINDPALAPKLDRILSPVLPTTPEPSQYHSRRDRSKSESGIDANIKSNIITDRRNNSNNNNMDNTTTNPTRHSYKKITSPTRKSHKNITIFPAGTTKTVRDLTLSPPQSTRIALMCTVCHHDFHVTDQESLMTFAGHVMKCDTHYEIHDNSSDSSCGEKKRRRSIGSKGSKSLSLSVSMSVPTATFQKMRSRIEERMLLSRRGNAASGGECA